MPVAFPFFNLPSTRYLIDFGGLDLFELKPFLSYRDMPNRIVLAWLDLSVNLFPTDAKYWLQASAMSCFSFKI